MVKLIVSLVASSVCIIVFVRAADVVRYMKFVVELSDPIKARLFEREFFVYYVRALAFMALALSISFVAISLVGLASR